MAKSLTAANAIILISVPGLFNVAQQLQQFAADDIFGTEPVERTEVAMGVDGFLSAGFVHVAIKQSYTLMADSDSNQLFDDWDAANQAAGETFPATGFVELTSVGSKWAMTRGFLTTFQPLPDAGKILKPRRHTITWERTQRAPT